MLIAKAELEKTKKEGDIKIIVTQENAKKEEINGNQEKASEFKNEVEILRKKDEEIKAAIEAQDIIIEDLDKERNLTVIAPDEPETSELPKLAGVHHRYTWDYSLENIELVPAELVIVEKNVDDKKVMDLIKEANGKITIPGLNIFKKQTLVTRSR
jgi:hypothetical protein